MKQMIREIQIQRTLKHYNARVKIAFMDILCVDLPRHFVNDRYKRSRDKIEDHMRLLNRIRRMKRPNLTGI